MQNPFRNLINRNIKQQEPNLNKFLFINKKSQLTLNNTVRFTFPSIQALIFLMLFIFLSKTLFVSLQNIINARNILVNNEKKDISLINDRIIHQRYHIKKVLFLMADRVKRKDKYFKKGKILEKYVKVKQKPKHIQMKLPTINKL